VDPLEVLFVREVMRTNVAVLLADSRVGERQRSLRTDHRQSQRLLPLCSALCVSRCEQRRCQPIQTNHRRLVVYRMAEKGFTRMPVIERDTREFIGLVSLDDLLKARARHPEGESRRERPLKLRFPGGRVSQETEVPSRR